MSGECSTKTRGQGCPEQVRSSGGEVKWGGCHGGARAGADAFFLRDRQCKTARKPYARHISKGQVRMREAIYARHA